MIKRSRNKMKRFIKKNGFLIAGIILLAALFTAIIFSSTVFLVKDYFNSTLINVVIPNNSSAKDIAKILKESGLIANEAGFYVSSLMLKDSQKLKAGSYYFSPDMTIYSILKKLETGQATVGPAKLTVPEGYSIYKISAILEKNGISVNGDFMALENGMTDQLVKDYPFLKDNPTRSLEGYLFPDTYMVPYRMTALFLAEIMLDRFEGVVMPVWRSSGITKYSLHQIITMASIIEKEAENDEERPVISSVFYNRLKNGIALRADPTVKYVLLNPTKTVKFSDLKIDSPYNTYKYKGLPPGPICSPGLKSILAAMYPAKTDYFYFVSNGDGTHTFSRTWDEHLKAAQKYRNRKRSTPTQ